MKLKIHQGPIPGADYATDYYSEAIKHLIESDPAFIQKISEFAMDFCKIQSPPYDIVPYMRKSTVHGDLEIILDIERGITIMLMSSERQAS